MVFKLECSVESEDYIEVEKVDESVIIEIANYYNEYPSDDERCIEFGIVNLKKNQVKELYEELGRLLEDEE